MESMIKNMWKQKRRNRKRERGGESLETCEKMKEWLDTCSNRWREREREKEWLETCGKIMK